MNTSSRVVEIDLPDPAPGMPIVSRLASEGVDKKDQSLIWALAGVHPLAKDFKIVRMFMVSDPDRVEIYSVSSDAKTGMRDCIPWARILIVGEAMPSLNIFVEELAAAEGGDEDPDDDEPEAPPQVAASGTSTNGQPAS